MTKSIKYGLLIETKNQYGTTYVTARAIGREEGKDHPINPSNNFGDEPLELDGLGIYGHLYRGSDGHLEVIGTEPRYQDVFSIEFSKAKRMARTLAKIQKQADKDAPIGAVDAFHSLAKAIKADFVVKRIGSKADPGWYEQSQWNWMTVQEGKRAYAWLIEEAIKAEHDRRAA